MDVVKKLEEAELISDVVVSPRKIQFRCKNHVLKFQRGCNPRKILTSVLRILAFV